LAGASAEAAESFFRKKRPVAVEREIEEEANAVVIGLERPASHAPLTQADVVRRALREEWTPQALREELRTGAERRES